MTASADETGHSHSNSARIAASVLALAAPAIGACQGAARPTPPVAKQVPFTIKSPHGDRVDEYY